MMRRVLVCSALLGVIGLAAGYTAWQLGLFAAKARSGVLINDPRAFQGYTLIAPMQSTKTFLVDMKGRVVKTWESDCTPAFVAYLLDNGNLLRTGKLPSSLQDAGGRVQEFSWDGELLWDYKFAGKNQHPHHDIARLPNGNILMILAERKTAKEAVAAGLKNALATGLLPDALVEIKPTGKTTGEIVWEWHVWNHLVQEFDKTKDNFGKVAEHPQRIDLNYGQGVIGKAFANKEEFDKLQALGYVGKTRGKLIDDWLHINSVDHHAGLDQIMLSVRAFNEIWIIDHSTTTKEAAGSTGGKYGKGGDLLYRWGNPQAHRAGREADQRLFQQHNAQWIAMGLPGAGNVLLFNNGLDRPGGSYSSVDEITLPVSAQGTYDAKAAPTEACWAYTAPVEKEFYCNVVSGAHRLPNGNTLICSGTDQSVFEVTPQKEIVWKFVCPELHEGTIENKKRGALFRAYRYGTNHPAFRGRTLD
jgi:hypothetical protein